MSSQEKDRNARSIQVLSRIQRALVRKLAEYVLENESSLRSAAEGAEGYGYTLQQLDELFLTRLNLIERAIAELQKFSAEGVSKYRSLCFSAPRDAVEQAINSRLEQLPNARVLGVVVSPASAAHPEMRAGPGGEGASPAQEELIVTVLYWGPAPAPEAQGV